MASIRWRKQDKEELARAVKNFNAKIARQAKKGRGYYQPEKFLLSDAKSMIKTRDDYREVMQYLKAYTQKGAEAVVNVRPGVQLTTFEVEQIKRAESRINKQRRQIRKKFSTQVGKLYSGSLLQELELRDIRLRPEKTPPQRIRTQLKLVRSSLAGYSEKILEARKANLLLSVERVFNGTFVRLEDYIKSTPASDLYGAKWEPLMSQEYMYSPDQLEVKRQMINSYLDRIGAP